MAGRSKNAIRVKMEMDIEPTSISEDISLAVIRLVSRLKRIGSLEGREVEPIVRDGFMQNFMHQRSGQGTGWAPLAFRTKKERGKQGVGVKGPILVRKGSYRDSWTSPRHTLSHFQSTTGGGITEISYGSRDSRVPLLEGGGKNPEGFQVPARPVSIMPGGQETRIGNELDSIMDRIGKESMR